MKDGLLEGPISEENKQMVQAYKGQNQRLIAEHLAKLPVREAGDESPIVFGSGKFQYRVVNDWAKLPPGWNLLDTPSVAVDKKDRVFVFNRGDHPVIVFDRDGNVIDHWGEGIFRRGHSIFVAPDGNLFMADDGNHAIFKCTPEGKILMTIGKPGNPAPFMSGDPFCRCTDVAMSPQGDLYVSDGYFNARIHKYSPDGKLLFSWGGPGNEPGEFMIPHNIVCDAEGWVYVADRENHRVQVFDGNGKYETQWNNMHRANALEQDPNGTGLFYLGESGPQLSGSRHIPNTGPRISIMNAKGERLAKLGTLPADDAPDRLLSPHGLGIDSRGDIYVGENAYTSFSLSFPNRPVPTHLRSLRKLVKIA